MRQGGGPKGPDYNSVTVQEPLPETEGPQVKKSLLAPGSPLEKPPEPGRKRYHKLTHLHTRISRTHLSAVIAVLMLIIAAFIVALPAVLYANKCSDEWCLTAGSAAEERKDGEVLPPCDNDWIWYKHKCFYFSEAEGTWTEAKDLCAALNSSLALIDTKKELDFLLCHKGDPDRWIGLWRDSDKQWRWINGTEFSNWFKVEDYSDYAYLNHHNIKSGESYNTRHWICTKVSTYERKYRRENTVLSFL